MHEADYEEFKYRDTATDIYNSVRSKPELA